MLDDEHLTRARVGILACCRLRPVAAPHAAGETPFKRPCA
jgi:hypothetical protein